MFEFDELIMKSLAKRYEGNLVRWGDPCNKGEGWIYGPDEQDKGDVWDLLVELWGERLTVAELELFRDALIEEGLERENWPLAYCEEEEDERPLSDYRTPEDEAADWLEAVQRGEIATHS